jgi:hypothetical protein
MFNTEVQFRTVVSHVFIDSGLAHRVQRKNVCREVEELREV